MVNECIVKFENLTKIFDDNIANNRICLEIQKGQIHALLGENGSGKSTLMKMLYGLYQPTDGRIYVRGEPCAFTSSNQAIEKGIFMIHQHFMLIPQMTVVENIIAGSAGNKPVLDLREIGLKVTELAARYGLRIDPNAYIYQLSVGEQQRVEIVKALYRGAEIMILDEPTSVLTPRETRDLLKVLRHMVENGKTILFITHKLEEVLEFADVCTVLRGGNKIETVMVADTDKAALSRMMVGRPVVFSVEKEPVALGEPVIRVEGLNAVNQYGRKVLEDVSFEVRSGEVLGISGVDGNGQTELSDVLTGMMEQTGGRIFLCGADVSGESVAGRIKKGIAFVPAERNGVGAIGSFSVEKNVILRDYDIPPYSRHGLLNKEESAKLANRLVRDYDVRLAGIKANAELLSGGNLQKVILARELNRNPKFLVCVQPTRGLDVGAIEYIHKYILEIRKHGTGILLISTELEEILTLSDRIAVLYGGRIMGVVDNDETLDIEKIGLMMAGSQSVAGKAVNDAQ